MFNKVKEVPLDSVINSGVYKLSIPYFVGQPSNLCADTFEGEYVYEVSSFPVEAYIRMDKDLEKGVFARFVIYENEKELVGYRYADLATVLRRAYFTAIFLPDVPERVKWIECRSAKKNDILTDEIVEVELKWNKETASYSFVQQKSLDSIFG
ncbi:hypothetical protein IEE_05466 [Bacillus cereus BAG5X1-1]|uniref:Uncharacterized protein n=1 Tax=Bacillus cereus BAG5X1-1 TaxID=1053189 RepID=J8A995_BACCE|nr:hypothetical protein [Bacillus cereus]EJQ36085.1 hypothetical protein IEE_05466 [Bacillus cereus BAG5X1-1]